MDTYGSASRMLSLCVWALLAVTSGCGPAVLMAEDAIVVNHHPVPFQAYVERRAPLGLLDEIEREPVQFLLNEQPIGQAASADEGRAEVVYHVDGPVPDTFAVRAEVAGQALEDAGRIFDWRSDRVVIAVDIDETLSETDYKQLLLGSGIDESEPIEGSQQVLRQLAQNYNILYVTARPRFLLFKSREWLKKYDYPPGPVFTAPKKRYALAQGWFKRKTLADLRERIPTLLIGIGDRKVDVDAYGPNGMLTVIVNEDLSKSYVPSALVVKDWHMLARVFEANRDVLADPQKIREVVAGQRMLLMPVLPWAEEDD